MSLIDTFNKLRTSIVGTKTSGIDAKLDTIENHEFRRKFQRSALGNPEMIPDILK